MTMNQDGRLALVIGATGGIGGAVAERLLAGGSRLNAAPTTSKEVGALDVRRVADLHAVHAR